MPLLKFQPSYIWYVCQAVGCRGLLGRQDSFRMTGLVCCVRLLHLLPILLYLTLRMENKVL